jgi:predicted ATP-grasp superfamily ATP-dependent carboligase
VVILRIGRARTAHGPVTAVRSLGRLGVPVHLVDESRLSSAALSRYSTTRVLKVDYPPLSHTVANLCELGESIGDRPVLITIDDVATLFVDEHADQLSRAFRFPRRPTNLPLRLADKGQLYDLCKELDIQAPHTVFPETFADVEALIDGEPTFPLVVKSMDPRVRRQRPGEGSVSIVNTPQELLDLYRPFESLDGQNLMVQEYIPGGPETIWIFNGYFNEDSDCLAGFTGRKIRQYPADTGLASFGVCEQNEYVMETSQRLMKSIGYRGIVDLGFRYDSRDGGYKLLDVNPRLGASFRLFVGQNGVDVLRALYLDLTHQEVPRSSPSDGRRWIVEPLDFWTAQTLVHRGTLTWRAWLRSLRGIQESAWFALDDPVPALATLAVSSRKTIVRTARLRRSSRSGDQ